MLERYGDLVESLGGSFLTGPDVNTGEADMDVIAERTAHVFCRSLENGGSGDPSTHTALGVFHGIRASVSTPSAPTTSAPARSSCRAPARWAGSWPRCSHAAGATVLVSDVDAGRARATGGTVVAPEDVLSTECDVYAPAPSEPPCPRRRSRGFAVASSPARRTTSSRRRRTATASARPASCTRPIRHQRRRRAPRHGLEQLGWTTEQLETEVERIGDTLLRIYADADAEGITTAEAAERLAAERLSRPAASSNHSVNSAAAPLVVEAQQEDVVVDADLVQYVVVPTAAAALPSAAKHS